jgi:hypothetical protein
VGERETTSNGSQRRRVWERDNEPNIGSDALRQRGDAVRVPASYCNTYSTFGLEDE